MKLRDLLVEAYHHIGDCRNSFDEDSGESVIGHFSDVSDFAVQEENAETMNREKFDHLVKLPLPKWLEDIRAKNKVVYQKYDNGVIAMYDEDDDVHYFFAQ